MSLRRVSLYTLLLLGCVVTASCSKSGSGGAAGVKLTGAGASFPAPLYERWFADYKKAHPETSVNYQALGSGAGIKQLTDETVDFAASDAAMTDEEIAKVKAGVVLLPMTAGSIVLAYNLPDVPNGIKLSREAYVGIFLRKITNWNDPAIAKTNEGVKFPDLAITPVVRGDSSGTTFVFTQHLSAISSEWKSGPGTGKTVEWPKGGVAPSKNAGVAGTIQKTSGAIGYVEAGFVKQANLPTAALQNKDGEFVTATTKSAQVALASVPMTDNLIVWIPDPAGKESYPIVTYTWLLTYKTYKDAAIVKGLKDVVKYGLTDGQKVSEELGYIPLPEDVTKKVLAKLEEIKP